MANFKRKRSRRQIRCSMCTPYRWRGNGTSRSGEGRLRVKDQDANRRAKREIADAKKSA